MPMHDDIDIKDVLGDPSEIASYHVYQWQHIDYLSIMPNVESLFETPSEAAEFVNAAKKVLWDAGWEGDGEMQILWLPPFLEGSVDDTYGTFCYHVKQSNNGTSWIASPVKLRFPRLMAQQY